METASNWSKQGWDIDCRCGRHIPRTTAWICGRCDHVNDPHHYSHSPERVPHLLYQCARCKWAPSAILCPECKAPFRLGPERVFRPAKVFIPLPKEVEEIARIKRQHEEKKEKLRQQYEIERFERSLRNETILLDLEELVQRVKGGKQFEKAALKMIEDLKADGYLTPKQEAMIVEFIEDKVLEAIHVDRRGGQSRHRPERERARDQHPCDRGAGQGQVALSRTPDPADDYQAPRMLLHWVVCSMSCSVSDPC